MRRCLVAVLLGVLACCGAAAWADEGMWTYDQFPSVKVGAAYGFAPDAAWLRRLRLASVRIAGGCSASVVSRQGLVMTNHHCARQCIQSLSGLRGKDFNRDGFVARDERGEFRCPNMEMNQLTAITDVTPDVQGATANAEPARFDAVQKTAIADIEKACATSVEWRCDVVSLFRGGQFKLYKYRRLQDIRLVFSPEDAIAFFGGDPDNFNFPRYDLDVTFLRIYGADGKPWVTGDYLPFSRSGAREGELTFVSGNPGGTSRGLTVAQFEDERDHELPRLMMRLSLARGWISEYQHRGPEQQRHSNDALFGVENSLKVFKGRHEALVDAAFFATLRKNEMELRARVAADPVLQRQYGDVWDQLAATTQKRGDQRRMLNALEDTYGSSLLVIARSIWRRPAQMAKPNGERLPEFTDSRLPQMRQHVLSEAPVYKELEIARLSHGLTSLREELGPDNALVKRVLGNKSPEQLASDLVAGTRLDQLQTDARGEATGGFRKALWDADAAALAANPDPLLKFVASYDADVLAARQRFEQEVEGPQKMQEQRLAQARFAVYGDAEDPDATFTLRLSYGKVTGWIEDGKAVPPFTDFAGAYRRHTGSDPFALPPSWLQARDRVDLKTPFNLVTNNDIIGGNSGSPLINQAGEVVGLVFDGNIHSLGGDYGFDANLNRTVAVDSRALLEALEHVYAGGHIAAEIRHGQR
jgi:hypothetical protein